MDAMTTNTTAGSPAAPARDVAALRREARAASRLAAALDATAARQAETRARIAEKLEGLTGEKRREARKEATAGERAALLSRRVTATVTLNCDAKGRWTLEREDGTPVTVMGTDASGRAVRLLVTGRGRITDTVRVDVMAD